MIKNLNTFEECISDVQGKWNKLDNKIKKTKIKSDENINQMKVKLDTINNENNEKMNNFEKTISTVINKNVDIFENKVLNRTHKSKIEILDEFNTFSEIITKRMDIYEKDLTLQSRMECATTDMIKRIKEDKNRLKLRQKDEIEKILSINTTNVLDYNPKVHFHGFMNYEKLKNMVIFI